MKICVIIPTYNHYKNLDVVVERVSECGLPIFVIDDGSEEPACSVITTLQNGDVTVYRLPHNQGKGAAVMAGFQLAITGGYTHAIQIDADGQHDLSALPRLMEMTKENPDALISGQPIYDASVPMGRKIGRWATHIWVWIETLSFRITDSMCGFRAYPLAAVQKLLLNESVGQRMDFDTDIMVRLFWRGTDVMMLPVKVIYPPDNTSNFDMLRDNWRITKMHTCLFLTMLTRLPIILKRRHQTETTHHWANIAERGGYWGLRFCAAAYHLLGRTGCTIVMAPIVLYFCLTGTKQRLASRQFLGRALNRQPSFMECYRHQMNFALRALDVLIAWTGGIKADAVIPTNYAELHSIVTDPRGGIMIVSHLGNADIARATLDKATRQRLTILAHTRHAENYNRVLTRFNHDAAMNVVQVTEIDPATIIDLQQRIEQGEWIVIAGDRTSVLSRDHIVSVPFFGTDAPFPQGPWILAALLECPVHLLFCLQNGDHHDITMERFAERITLPRPSRDDSLRNYVTRYAQRLEHYAARAPFQWYNFFDFWAKP